MATLTTRKRKRIPNSDFAYPERRKLPISDAGHVRAAVGRFSRTQFDSAAAMKRAAVAILRAAKKHGVEIGESTYVARAARGEVSGQRRNPSGRTGKRAGDPELAAARRISERFHGNAGEVIELSERERRLPRYVVALGKMPALEYEPDARSKRGGANWRHESGDRGPLATRSRKKPTLAVDPATGRPVIVPMGSPMKLDPRRGLVG